ncbi:MAG: hypothetical protein J6I68_15570 [Butyrivibrio sp.]|uniref:hypothetical protein n=1 Tax=Butyrivibrio sp. TaxID=28121 RepID=UPI001B4541E9|nr:hypothetical protein [Butyrivibrio sp.]MBP3784653.1 hypothetical protein [Butyrivibrio sp.]
MITIALDEQGDFENLKHKLRSEPVFIGGIIYDDAGDSDDYDREKNRLQKYFKNVCSEAGGNYPRDLHYWSSGGTNNSHIVGAVKTKFGETIEEFLENGTWKGSDILHEQRKGKYYIFASLRGKNGKTDLLAGGVSEAVREDFASNLYVHMAEDVVERLLFYNPVIDNIEQIRLELATRRVILDGTDRTSKMQEYEKLGFKAVQRSTGQNTPSTTEYLLTNPDNYRTALEREMLHSGKNTILIDRIAVKSIYYDHARNGMDLLYLADAICSHLSYNRRGSTPGEWISSFYDMANDINSDSHNMIWGYDDADVYFDKGWKAIERADYFEALSMGFDGTKCSSTMKDFYSKEWYPMIADSVLRTANVAGLSTAIKKYKNSIFANNINQEKLVYIFKILEKAGEKVLFFNKKDEAELYDLYDAGVSAYTHIGDSENAKKCFEKTQQYAEYVATEVFLRTRNRMVVFLGDMLEFHKALEIADENVVYHELLLEMKKQIFKDDKYESLNHAIALSQRAQIYAFLDDERAEEDFLAAMEIMDPETPDRLITESYLLHYYISIKNKEKYEELAKEYYGGKESLIDQFNFIANEGAKDHARFSLKFAFYVYIKAVYEFYLDSVPKKLLNKLKTTEKSLSDLNKNAQRQINGHPWEITYKYLALILKHYNEDTAADEYVNKIREYVNNSEGIIKGIAEESVRICESSNGSVKDSKFTYMYT